MPKISSKTSVQSGSKRDTDVSNRRPGLNKSPSGIVERSADMQAPVRSRAPPLVSPPKASRDLMANPGAVEEAIAGSRKSKGNSQFLDMQEPTASRNRFQDAGAIGTPPWNASTSPDRHRREFRDNNATAPGTSEPRACSPSERLKLLTPIDLVEIVTDLERHFAKEPPGSTPRNPDTNGVGAVPKSENAEKPDKVEKAEKAHVEKVMQAPAPVPMPARSPVLFGRVRA